MIKNIFAPENFFDLSDFEHREIFSSIKNVWEVLPKISDFIKSHSKENIMSGEGTKVDKTSIIQGPFLAGKNCLIQPGAFIRENCILGNNVIVGHGVELKNCVVLNNTYIAHLNYVGDSIVGGNVNVAGGAIVANLRLDAKNVTVRTGEGRIDTGLAKFGSIIGDGSKIGANAVLNPGTILGKNCLVYPLTQVLGFHPNNEKINRSL